MTFHIFVYSSIRAKGTQDHAFNCAPKSVLNISSRAQVDVFSTSSSIFPQPQPCKYVGLIVLKSPNDLVN